MTKQEFMIIRNNTTISVVYSTFRSVYVGDEFGITLDEYRDIKTLLQNLCEKIYNLSIVSDQEGSLNADTSKTDK